MWTKNSEGKILWSESAKLTLIGLLKRNPEALNTAIRFNPKKIAAWQKVYDGLIRAKMPKSTIVRVKKAWVRLQRNAKARYDEQLKQYSKNGKFTPLSKLDDAVINLLNIVNPSQKPIWPKPKIEVKIKKEPLDPEDIHDEDVKPSIVLNQTQQNMNPRVLLQRIGNNETTDEMPPNGISKPNDLSIEYWTMMTKIAESDLNLKLMQRKHEEERMQIEREIHLKNMIVLDLKIQVQQMQINALRGPNNFD